MECHAERAGELFLQGYNCAQSVFLAFSDELGLDRSAAARMASSFGAGMGRLREVCGAVCAMFLIAGIAAGYDDPADTDAKAAHYRRIQALAAQFRQRHGTLICRELLGLEKAEGTPVAEERTAEYYQKRPCPMLVRVAADVMAEYMAAHPLPRTGGAQAGPPAQEPAAR